ncbi:ATP-binding protein [Salisaeta longa]|uniref:ATP-binding protein n=1 Tax=Salisaeta longa TaxID=503170 RepID=UPI0003B38BC9|nr:ATP-binding protein [Salisaeta longa]
MKNTPTRWWMGIGALLLIAALTTWGARSVWLSRLEARPAVHRQAQVQDALHHAQRAFAEVIHQTRTAAERWATRPALVRELWQATEQGKGAGALMRIVSTARLPARTALEVYAPTPRLLAWNGPRLPLSDAPNTASFLERPQVRIVTDGDIRTALAVWWPIQRNGAVIGVVRWVRVLRFEPPIRNRYLQAYSITETWSAETPWPVALIVQPSPAAPAAQSATAVVRTAEGHRLATLSVRAPSLDALRERAAQSFDDALSVIGLLALLWLLTGLLYGYVHAATAARRLRWLIGMLCGLIGLRVWALWAHVPARWIGREQTLYALFEPTYLASSLGMGLMRSVGDLLLSGLVAFALSALLLYHARTRWTLRATGYATWRHALTTSSDASRPFLFAGGVAVLASLMGGLCWGLSHVVERAVLDSTLNFFARSGLLPEPLLLVVLCALLLLTAAGLMTGGAAVWAAGPWLVRRCPRTWEGLGRLLAVALVTVGGAYLLNSTAMPVSPGVLLGWIALIGSGSLVLLARHTFTMGVLVMRGLLLVVLVLTAMLYPLLYEGMDQQRRSRMREAALAFDEGRDPRALFSIEQVFDTAIDVFPRRPQPPATVDSTVTQLLRQSLLASLTTYATSLALLDATGTPLAYASTVGGGMQRADQAVFRAWTSGASWAPGERRVSRWRSANDERLRPQYVGLMALPGRPRTWLLMRAEPRPLLPGTGTGVPRVLLPDGSFTDLYAELSLAAFQDGLLTRSLGRDFDWARLPQPLQQQLQTTSPMWRQATISGTDYLTYYQNAQVQPQTVVAVRIPSVRPFDHLYYMLRLSVAGMLLALLAYVVGLAVRYDAGYLPAPRIRFRDKVLNALLGVGVLSVIAVGAVGVQVVTTESARDVTYRLHDQLSRVEELLAARARPEERIYEVLARTDVDSLAAQAGLDLNVYIDARLMATSRPRLVRDRLMERRLPGPIYHRIYYDHYRFVTAPSDIGSFRYAVGYQALLDDTGTPRYIVAVPTIAQQERLQEERARTLAYFFGGLLLLVGAALATALPLANALTRPIGRLRTALEAVGEGRYVQPLPVETRDEIGTLVHTFNEMRAQLSESRRKLARQEREMAWREMARQVAHEIKNPLTPMKLSVQHLQRAFQRVEGESTPAWTRFAELFSRVTAMVVEQADTLVRIADEFSSFARMPKRVAEPLDLNAVVQEAVRVMESDAPPDTIRQTLADRPLIVSADHEELRRIFINLIKNALHALPDGEGTVHIQTQEAPTRASHARATVRDTGTGVPDDIRDKIFEPNFSTKNSGTGLGLAIAQRAVDALGGRMGFETETGVGTTFWIELPLADHAPDASD